MFTIFALLLTAVVLWYLRKDTSAFFTAPPDLLAEVEDAVKSEREPQTKPVPKPATGAATPTAPPKV